MSAIRFYETDSPLSGKPRWKGSWFCWSLTLFVAHQKILLVICLWVKVTGVISRSHRLTVLTRPFAGDTFAPPKAAARESIHLGSSVSFHGSVAHSFSVLNAIPSSGWTRVYPRTVRRTFWFIPSCWQLWVRCHKHLCVGFCVGKIIILFYIFFIIIYLHIIICYCIYNYCNKVRRY